MYPGRTGAGGFSRDQQIQGLITAMKDMRRTSAPGQIEHYDIGIRLNASNTIIVLRLYLPDMFPNESPVIQVINRVTHPNLDSNCFYIAHPMLGRGWTAASGNLAKLVQDVMRELTTHPPQIVSGPPPPQFAPPPSANAMGRPPMQPPVATSQGYGARGPPPAMNAGGMGGAPPPPDYSASAAGGGAPPPGGWRMPSAAAGGAGGGAGAAGPDRYPRMADGPPPPIASPPPASAAATAESRVQRPEQSDIPAPPSQFPDLNDKAFYELQALLQDTKTLQGMVEAHPEVQVYVNETTRIVRDTRTSSLEKARANMRQISTVDELTGQVESLRSVAESAKAALDARLAERASVADRFSAPALEEAMRTAAQQAYAESEEIGQAFADKRIDTNEFLRRFLASRQAYHARNARAEILHRFGVSMAQHK